MNRHGLYPPVSVATGKRSGGRYPATRGLYAPNRAWLPDKSWDDNVTDCNYRTGWYHPKEPEEPEKKVYPVSGQPAIYKWAHPPSAFYLRNGLSTQYLNGLNPTTSPYTAHPTKFA